MITENRMIGAINKQAKIKRKDEEPRPPSWVGLIAVVAIVAGAVALAAKVVELIR